ncbi:MAG TPA: hypothetical protein VHN99_01490, partial [Deinococcales bacterium]|nr:hypothetical protein [Deinococcales bacterium]
MNDLSKIKAYRAEDAQSVNRALMGSGNGSSLEGSLMDRELDELASEPMAQAQGGPLSTYLHDPY